MPQAAAEYIYSQEDGFKESGAQDANLKTRSVDYSLFIGEAGLRIGKCFSASTSFDIYIEGNWVHEQRNRGAHYVQNFVGYSPSFRVIGIRPSRSLFAPGAGFVLNLQERAELSMSWKGHFNGNNYENHTVNVQAGFQF